MAAWLAPRNNLAPGYNPHVYLALTRLIATKPPFLSPPFAGHELE